MKLSPKLILSHVSVFVIAFLLTLFLAPAILAQNYSTSLDCLDASGCSIAYQGSDYLALTSSGIILYTNILGNQKNITHLGAIGIGVSTPSQLLEVAGAIKIGDTSNPQAGTIRWTGTDFQGYNGTTWLSLTHAGIEGSGLAGQIAYWSGSSSLSGSNNLYWDITNNRLGIGTTYPNSSLHVVGAIKADAGEFGSLNGSFTIPLSRLEQGGASTNQALIWSGSAWSPTTIDFSIISGTVSTSQLGTSVTPATLSGTGYIPSGWTIALTNIEQGGALTDQVLAWNGTAWSPSSLSAGTGISVSGLTISINTASSLTWTSLQTFTAGIKADTISEYATGAGITIDDTLKVNTINATAGITTITINSNLTFISDAYIKLTRSTNYLQLGYDSSIGAFKIYAGPYKGIHFYAEGSRILQLGADVIYAYDDFLPSGDNLWTLGSSTLRWANLYAVTTTIGDIVFANNFTITEGDKVGLEPDCLAILNPRGEVIAKLTDSGDLYVVGRVYEGWVPAGAG